MNRVLPRRDLSDVEPTMFLRSPRPEDHRDFEKVLPWMTPLFVFRMQTEDYVRWSIPRDMALRMGIAGGCSCCGDDTTIEGDLGDFHVDTAWNETDWWLEANGYSNPDAPKKQVNPTKKEGN